MILNASLIVCTSFLLDRMPVIPASEHLPSAWECGLRAEVGCIWFTTLVPFEASKYIEIHYHNKLVAACRYLPTFPNKQVEKIHKLATMMCSVVKTRNIIRDRKCYAMINCMIRVKTYWPIRICDKEPYLKHLSRSLFRAFNSLIAKEEKFLEKHPGFIFNNPTGFLLTNKFALKMAIRTLCYEVANVILPQSVPHCAYGSKGVIGISKTFYVDKEQNGSAPTQPFHMRSMLKTIIPQELHRLVMPGICYCPAVKYYTNDDKEAWCMHIHTPFNEEAHNATDEETKKQPLSLQDLTKFSLIETSFKIRRARLSKQRKSPYYKLKL